MARLTYTLSKRINPNGKAEVLARFNARAHTSFYAHTHIFAPVAYWNVHENALNLPNKATLDAKIIIDTQMRLNSLQSAIFDLWEKDMYIAGSDWLQKVVDDYMLIPDQAKRKRMPDIVAEYIEQSSKAPRTTAAKMVVLRLLQEYETTHEPLYADEFTPDMVAKVIAYYRTRPLNAKPFTRTNNTLATKERILRTICNYAVRKGYMQKSPFGKAEYGLYEKRTELYGDIIYLTSDELRTLTDYTFADATLSRVRDIFVFQCHIGCRVSDLRTLTADNIQNGFIQYIPIKTRNTSAKAVRVPLDETALGIIERYKGGDMLLPFVADATYNEYIHIIAKQAGLNRRIITLKGGVPINLPLWQVCTSHTARKTFAQRIFSITHSELLTSSLTGHSGNTKVFGRYAQVDDDMKREIINNLTHGNGTE